jgi:signal transduction histidine kinase
MVSPGAQIAEPGRSSARQMAFIVGPAVVVGLVATAALWSGRISAAEDAWVYHTHEVALTLASVLQRMTDAETAERGFVITGDTAFLAPYGGAAAAVGAGLDSLRALTIDNPPQTARIDTLMGLAHRRSIVLGSTIGLRTDRGLGAAEARIASGQERRLMDSTRVIADRIRAEEARLLVIRQAATNWQRRVTQLILFAGALLAAIIAIAVNGYMSAQQDELARRNQRLRDQSAELEMQNQHLQEQAVELEAQTHQLQDQAIELEQQSDQVGEQAIELEVANEQLQLANEALTTANDHLEIARLAAVEASEIADRARMEAEAANAAKSTFLATMSHELRTPLNAIGGYVDLLLAEIRGPLTDQQTSDLTRIRRAGTHLLGLINDVLNLAKLETGQIAFSHDVMGLHEALVNAATMIEPQAAVKGVAFSRISSSDDGLTVAGDRDKILQIVLNLLANAVKFTPEGGRVSLSGRHVPGDGAIEIVVSDTGRGMPPDQLVRIFEPFVQVGRRLSGADAGAGLGLAISRELARGMGGEITVTSVEGAGSTFVVRLPATGSPSELALSSSTPARDTGE